MAGIREEPVLVIVRYPEAVVDAVGEAERDAADEQAPGHADREWWRSIDSADRPRAKGAPSRRAPER
jgi:hypothetical protein